MKCYNFIHLVYTPMTGVGLGAGYRSDDWFKNRIEIFKNYTLKSLQNQTQKNFCHWLSFRPEERSNPLVEELAFFLKEQKYAFIFTFNGLMYHDDKFSKDLKTKLLNTGRIIRSILRGQSVFGFRELFENKNDSLEERLGLSLSFLSESLNNSNVKRFEWVYLTRIDSDDMFHKDAIDLIQRTPPFKGALVFKNGFVYDKNSEKLADWKPNTNPPFHTIIFPKKDFFNPQRHLNYYGGYISHEDIIKLFNVIKLTDYKYCVLVHGNQISTVFNHPFRGDEIVGEMKGEILSNFGIWE